MKNIAIIGAGLSGLTLATHLSDIAVVTVFEKHHQVSGRMATREHNGYAYDHGAQFFTVKHPAFQALVDDMQAHGVVRRWNARFAEIDGVRIKAYRDWDADFPHYVGMPNMAKMGQWIEKELQHRGVQTQCHAKVVALKKQGDAWTLLGEDGQVFGQFDWVITAIPSAQAVQLLPEDIEYLSTLRQVQMLPCYALMLGFEHPIELTWDVAHVANNPVLSWVSVNSSKPKRNAFTTLVVMSTNQWAAEHLDASEAWVTDTMTQALSAILGNQVFIAKQRHLKKWHYANAQKNSLNKMLIDKQLQLASCGDWCISGRVESAFVSAFQLAEALRDCVALEHNS